MSRLVVLSAVAALAACAAAPAQARAPVAVGVSLREYSITLYKSKLRTGRVSFELKNFGEDPHDLRVFGPRGYVSSISPPAAPFGGTGRLRATLRRPGTYRLVCTLGDHAARGMRATVRVTRRRS